MEIARHLVRKAVPLLAAVGLTVPQTAMAACADPFALRAETGRMEFKQTRWLSQFPKPLVSEGHAVVSSRRIEWQVMKPVDVRTVITPKGVTQSVDGGPYQPIAGAANPFLQSTGLFALLTGDFAALRRFYEVGPVSQAAGGDWIVKLKPRERDLARFLTAIEVRGCQRPSLVTLHQANGDRMEVRTTPPVKAASR